MSDKDFDNLYRVAIRDAPLVAEQLNLKYPARSNHTSTPGSTRQMVSPQGKEARPSSGRLSAAAGSSTPAFNDDD
jgi:hypothetical protein